MANETKTRLPKSGAARRCKAGFATTRRTAFVAGILTRGESVNAAIDCQKSLTSIPVSGRERLARCRLTPELSRAERDGWEPVLPGCPEDSTKSRNGVGLNDLLGGQDAGEGKVMKILPKTEAQMHERARELSVGHHRSECIWSGQTNRKPIIATEAGKRDACTV